MNELMTKPAPQPTTAQSLGAIRMEKGRILHAKF